jgi:REP element-mobilizing transposase RayT
MQRKNHKLSSYNPTIHHRRSIRLKGYDYAQEDLYFITICCQDKAHLFGEIVDGEMILNECGEIANNCWLEIPNHYPNVGLHQHIIMPNHVHGIIEIKYKSNLITVFPTVGANDYSPLRSPSKTIGSIVRGFKIGVTKWMRQNTHIYDVWQRNYFENIVRNKQSYHQITKYIQNNPENWKDDRFNLDYVF